MQTAVIFKCSIAGFSFGLQLLDCYLMVAEVANKVAVLDVLVLQSEFHNVLWFHIISDAIFQVVLFQERLGNPHSVASFFFFAMVVKKAGVAVRKFVLPLC
jgi:hypothetical protein